LAAPEAIAPGAGFPISLGTYEKKTVTLELYGLGIEIHKHDLPPFRQFNILQRALKKAGQRMAIYQEKKITSALDGVTENSESRSGLWTTFTNAVKDIAEAIRFIEEDNVPGGATDLIVSPRVHEVLLSGMTITAEAIAAPGVIREGRVTNFLGLNVNVTNNLPDDDDVFVVAKNEFGWMPQAYAISTMAPEFVRELMCYRAFIYAMDAFVLDQPKAVAAIREVLTP